MIFDLFSKRKKKNTRAGEPDVYQYDEVSRELRVQIQQILIDAIGPQYQIDPYGMSSRSHNPDAWRNISKTLCRELGVHSLADRGNSVQQVIEYIGACPTEQFIDAVELCVKYIHHVSRAKQDYQRSKLGITQPPDEAIDEINYRFRESRLGYQFEAGEVFRVDSQFVHEEAIKPALKILNGPGLQGPREEFLEAHRQYRTGHYEQAIIEAGKSFESTLKAVCDLNQWEYNSGSRASDLLKIVRGNNLWPDYLDASFDQLVATLGSGLPKVRNGAAAHGQGAAIRSTPAYVAGYALHLCAAKIVLIADAQQARLKK